ncbi:hypothetical protein ACIQVL_48925 [Streptomyces sp. NPDC090499]|uniref:hypothetical protein n=1 Tax=Streptomyces sp. NPDC090499 TaxID=3365965 RepID=UPI00382A153A
MSQQHNDGFDEVINGGFQQTAYTVDPNPYGIPANSIPVKPGLTPRGKIALAVGAAAIATSGLVGYQVYSADQAASQAKAAEISYKQDQLELEKLKVLNETNKAQNSTDQARQKQIDACVKDNKDLVGKSMNSTYRDIVEACQAQYTSAGASPDLQTAASSTSSGGGINNGLLIGGSVLAIGFVVAVRKGTRGNAA